MKPVRLLLGLGLAIILAYQTLHAQQSSTARNRMFEAPEADTFRIKVSHVFPCSHLNRRIVYAVFKDGELVTVANNYVKKGLPENLPDQTTNKVTKALTEENEIAILVDPNAFNDDRMLTSENGSVASNFCKTYGRHSSHVVVSFGSKSDKDTLVGILLEQVAKDRLSGDSVAQSSSVQPPNAQQSDAAGKKLADLRAKTELSEQKLHAQRSAAAAKTLGKLRAEAEEGDANAQLKLGDALYLGSLGLTTDVGEAVKWLRKAAEQGNPEAQHSLSNCYAKGEGAPRDYVEAAKWILLAAQNGDDRIKRSLAHAERNISPEDFAEGKRRANDWLEQRKQASAALASQRFRLEQHTTDAKTLASLRAKATKGNAKSQSKLGDALWNGELGLAQDKWEAVKWYCKANELWAFLVFCAGLFIVWHNGERILCMFGMHTWQGCRCCECGKKRDKEHKWHGCKCKRCGTTRDEGHAWNDSSKQCSRCGLTYEANHSLGTQTESMECPPFRGSAACSDDNCPCNDTAIPPAKGYLYISPEVVKNRRDCLTREQVEAKFSRMKAAAGGSIILNGGQLLFPIVVCERAARLRNLDLEVAAKDYDTWVASSMVLCRVTPTTKQAPQSTNAGASGCIRSHSEHISRRINSMETADELFKHLRLLQSGKKQEAIEAYAAQMGVTIETATKAIELLIATTKNMPEYKWFWR